METSKRRDCDYILLIHPLVFVRWNGDLKKKGLRLFLFFKIIFFPPPADGMETSKRRDCDTLAGLKPELFLFKMEWRPQKEGIATYSLST